VAENILYFIAGLVVMKIGLEWFRTLMVKWRYKVFVDQIYKEAIEARKKPDA